MPISELLSRPCTLLLRSRSSEDAYGNETRDTVEVDTVCEVQQQQRTEDVAEAEVSDTRWAGYFLPGTELNTGDAVRIAGLGTLELIGEPWTARDPELSTDSHVEATLRLVAGSEEGS